MPAHKKKATITRRVKKRVPSVKLPKRKKHMSTAGIPAAIRRRKKTTAKKSPAKKKAIVISIGVGKIKKKSPATSRRKKYGARKESANKVSKEARREHRSQMRKRVTTQVGPGSKAPQRRTKAQKASDKKAWTTARAAKKAFKKNPNPKTRAALKTAKRRKAQVKQRSAARAYRKFM